MKAEGGWVGTDSRGFNRPYLTLSLFCPVRGSPRRHSPLSYQINMASNASVEEAKADIEEKGFHKIDDPEIGTKIALMRDKSLSFYMHHESGFQFCRDHVLLNQVGFSLLAMIDY